MNEPPPFLIATLCMGYSTLLLPDSQTSLQHTIDPGLVVTGSAADAGVGTCASIITPRENTGQFATAHDRATTVSLEQINFYDNIHSLYKVMNKGHSPKIMSFTAPIIGVESISRCQMYVEELPPFTNWFFEL